MTGITKEEAVKMFARCAEVADTDEDIVAIFTNAILERAAVGKTVLACNALGYVGKAVLRNGKWENIGRPTGWMLLPKAPE